MWWESIRVSSLAHASWSRLRVSVSVGRHTTRSIQSFPFVCLSICLSISIFLSLFIAKLNYEQTLGIRPSTWWLNFTPDSCNPTARYHNPTPAAAAAAAMFQFKRTNFLLELKCASLLCAQLNNTNTKSVSMSSDTRWKIHFVSSRASHSRCVGFFAEPKPMWACQTGNSSSSSSKVKLASFQAGKFCLSKCARDHHIFVGRRRVLCLAPKVLACTYRASTREARHTHTHTHSETRTHKRI